jgi:hypothetical protein
MRWIISNAKEARMKKTIKFFLLLIVILAVLIIAARFVSFDLLVRNLHDG